MIILSQCSQEQRNQTHLDIIQRAKKRDEELCSQYTLTFTTVSCMIGAFGKDKGVRRTSTLPILFCGIHNPARERSFYGLYPGGKHIDTETLRFKLL